MVELCFYLSFPSVECLAIMMVRLVCIAAFLVRLKVYLNFVHDFVIDSYRCVLLIRNDKILFRRESWTLRQAYSLVDSLSTG